MRFKGILMDIDNTLYDYESVHSIALTGVLKTLSEETRQTEECLRKGYDTARKEVHHDHPFTASGHNRALYFQRMCEHLGLNAGEWVYFADQLYWDTFIANMRLFPGVTDFLEATRSMPLVFVTDLLAQVQFRKIKQLKLYSDNTQVVTSEEVGVEKPDARIFQAALAKINLSTEETCMIGDSLTRDILGAKALGIHAFWFRGKPHKLENSQGITCFDQFEQLKVQLL